MGYHALGSLEIWELEQHSKCYYIAFDEFTDIRIYLYVEVDWTRIHQYLKRLYFGAQIGGGISSFQFFSRGEQKIFENSLGENRCFLYTFPIPEAPGGSNK